MKKLLLILLLIVSLSGCRYIEGPMDRFNRMTLPIMVVAEEPEGAVTLCGANGFYVILPLKYYTAKTISDSYQIGDTLLFVRTNKTVEP